ncbi:MAG: VCBS repeat-containing protein [Thermodesulfovibrionales bacterium]|nr:VCBS repeat-containing protein [Thermodesulfovibrionales bacterium]
MFRNIIIFAFTLYLMTFLSFSASAQNKESKKEHEKSLTILKEELISYFKPVAGSIVAANGDTVKIDAGQKQLIKVGMRLNAFKEGASFVHPVTKEPLGKIEIPVGNIEIISISENDSTGKIIKGKVDDFKDAKVKIPGTKVKVLFYQGNVDWFLGDSYYQMLKESGRFELIDTGIQTDDVQKIISEAKAKGADIALILSSSESKDHINLTQKILMVNDSKQFSETKSKVDIAHVKELRFKAGLFSAKEGEAILSFQLPFGARRLAIGDIDGDGNPEIILASGDHIKVYAAGVDLKLLWDFKIPSTTEVLWVDTADSNKNKRDEVLITSLYDTDIISFIYELRGSDFVQIHKFQDTFLRRIDNNLIGQKYTKSDGYDGNVFTILYSNGTYKSSDSLKLPQGVNIYDFQRISSTEGKQTILAWDEAGYLHLYDEKGIRVWVSAQEFGGFLTQFKKESPIVMIDRGSWSVKDRLVLLSGNEVLAVKRKPLLGIAKGLGYKSSEIKSFWWNGITIEEGSLLKEIGGEILDYAIVGDRIVVLSKPLFGIRAGNILKGENPFGTMLYIFSLKGI